MRQGVALAPLRHMRQRNVLMVAAAWILGLGAPAATGQTTTSPAEAVQARQSQFREIGTAFKAINDELRKDAPGKFALASSARQIATDLKQAKLMFPAGSGPVPGVKNKARPEIWTNRATFDKAGAAAIVEADKLVAVMRGGDQTAMTTQAKALGATCQACHRQFRAED